MSTRSTPNWSPVADRHRGSRLDSHHVAGRDLVGGQKRLDVKVADPSLGLILCISIKTYSFRDYSPTKKKLGRWTKNIKRNDHELRGEAMVLHQRQPYSALVAVIFEPFATCDDGESSNSSFAHHVDVLKKRSGRGKRPIRGTTSPAWVEFGAEDPRYELFERVLIGLYEHEGPERGSVKFFDVEKPPPKKGRPATEDLLTFQQFIELVDEDVSIRNSKAPVWSDTDDDSEEDEEEQ